MTQSHGSRTGQPGCQLKNKTGTSFFGYLCLQEVAFFGPNFCMNKQS